MSWAPDHDCDLHAKLTAKNETTGSNSVAKGHTLIKVRNNGTIQFKKQINNKNRETFVRAGTARPSSKLARKRRSQ